MPKKTSKRIKEVTHLLGLIDRNALNLERIGEDLLNGMPLLSVCAHANELWVLRRQVSFLHAKCSVTTIEIPEVDGAYGDEVHGFLRWKPLRDSENPDTIYKSVDWALFVYCFQEAICYKGKAYGDYPSDVFEGTNLVLLKDVSIDLEILAELLKPDTTEDEK